MRHSLIKLFHFSNLLQMPNVYRVVDIEFFSSFLGSCKRIRCDACSHAMQETQVWSLGWQDPLEKEISAHSSILAWRIPQTEEPGGLQSMESQRVGHDWATNTHTQLVVVNFRRPATMLLIFKALVSFAKLLKPPLHCMVVSSSWAKWIVDIASCFYCFRTHFELE